MVSDDGGGGCDGVEVDGAGGGDGGVEVGKSVLYDQPTRRPTIVQQTAVSRSSAGR